MQQETDVDRIIGLRGFPSDNEASPVVVASALHRTYKIRTNPSMVTFYENGVWCSVKLASSADRRHVLSLSQLGTNPILHNRDPLLPSCTLEVLHKVSSISPPDTLLATRYLDENKTTKSIIQLSGLPGDENKFWDGVRMTPTVIASMMHRTFGVRTNPDNVTFNNNRTKSWIDLGSTARAQKVLENYRTGTVPILHHHSMDPSEPFAQIPIQLSPHLDDDFDDTNALTCLQHPPQSQAAGAMDGGKELLTLGGFPGGESMWRFLTENVVASLLHRNFGVRTSASTVTMSRDRRMCQVHMSGHDARHFRKCLLEEGGGLISVFHHDRKVGDLVVSEVSPLEFEIQRTSAEERSLFLEQDDWHFTPPSSLVANSSLGQGLYPDPWKFDELKSVLVESSSPLNQERRADDEATESLFARNYDQEGVDWGRNFQKPFYDK